MPHYLPERDSGNNFNIVIPRAEIEPTTTSTTVPLQHYLLNWRDLIKIDLEKSILLPICSLYSAESGERKYLNTRFPLPTLLCAGYSVKLIYLFYLYVVYNNYCTTPCLTFSNTCTILISILTVEQSLKRNSRYRSVWFGKSNNFRDEICFTQQIRLSLLLDWN